MKKNRGVTLIALIITIIVLLVLAGVSISALVGDNGILTRAASVEEEYSKGELEEQLTMIINEKLLDAYETISNNEDSVDISTEFNEYNLITFLLDNNYIEIGQVATESGYENSSTIRDVLDQIDVNLIYFINASNISSNIDAIGTGSNDGTFENIFTLEVIVDSDDSTKSSGYYNLNYYNNDGICETLTTIYLYTTNQSP